MAETLMVCTTCGYCGTPKTKINGNLATEIFLWLFMLLPGVLYSLWRLSSKEKVCPKCEHSTMIPANTPMARRLLNDQTKSRRRRPSRSELLEDPVDKWERENAK